MTQNRIAPISSVELRSMTTRDRILETARLLFNDEGIGNISANRITVELGISPGNVYYHFKNKKQIVESLFRRFQTTMDQFRTSAETVAGLHDLGATLTLVFQTIGQYRFIYRDVEIMMREYSLVRTYAPMMAREGIESARQACIKLVDNKVLHANAREIDALARQIVLTLTCWYSFANLVAQDHHQASSPEFAAYQVLSLMLPYVRGDSLPYLESLQAKYLP